MLSSVFIVSSLPEWVPGICDHGSRGQVRVDPDQVEPGFVQWCVERGELKVRVGNVGHVDPDLLLGRLRDPRDDVP